VAGDSVRSSVTKHAISLSLDQDRRLRLSEPTLAHRSSMMQTGVDVDRQSVVVGQPEDDHPVAPASRMGSSAARRACHWVIRDTVP
jgi:hypothetical protein